MSSQKLPLFGGLIQPVHVGAGGGPAAVTQLFVPPDADQKAPILYELHLWVITPATNDVMTVWVKDLNTGKEGLAWAGKAAADNFFVPQKILDGYPVRGNVQVRFESANVAGADNYPHGTQLMGYYVPVGLGVVREEERRPLGQAAKNVAGVPFVVAVAPVPAGFPSDAPTDVVIHTFENGHIDEMSIGFTSFVEAGSIIRLTFERKDNTPVIPGHYVSFVGYQSFGPNSFGDAGGGSPYGVFPVSPYIIHKVPFGGNDDLHHLRVTALPAKSTAAGVHGYFVRK